MAPIYTFSLAGNIIVCQPSKSTNRERYNYKIQHKRLKFRLWREINNFHSIPSLIGRVLLIFRPNKDRPNPSEFAITVLVHAPSCHLTNTAPFFHWKTEKIKG